MRGRVFRPRPFGSFAQGIQMENGTTVHADPKMIEAVRRAVADLGPAAGTEAIRGHMRITQGLSFASRDAQAAIDEVRGGSPRTLTLAEAVKLAAAAKGLDRPEAIRVYVRDVLGVAAGNDPIQLEIEKLRAEQSRGRLPAPASDQSISSLIAAAVRAAADEIGLDDIGEIRRRVAAAVPDIPRSHSGGAVREIHKLRIERGWYKKALPNSTLAEAVALAVRETGSVDYNVVTTFVKQMGIDASYMQVRDEIAAQRNAGQNDAKIRLRPKEKFALWKWAAAHSKVAKNDKWTIDTALAEATQALDFRVDKYLVREAFSLHDTTLARRPLPPRKKPPAAAPQPAPSPAAQTEPTAQARQPQTDWVPAAALIESRLGQLEADVRRLLDKLAPLLEDPTPA